MTCEHCRNTGHIGDNCSEGSSKDVNFINNNFSGSRPQPGWSSHPQLPFLGQGNSSGNTQSFNKNPFDQKTINDSISKKFLSNDRVLETLSLQMETLNSAMKNQLSFNKMLETQIAQLATALLSPTSGKLPGQPEPPPKEHIAAITTRGGKSTQDPPHPRTVGQMKVPDDEPEEEKEQIVIDPPTEKEAPRELPQEFHDMGVLPFPPWQKKVNVDEQFGKFVEVIKKLYVNIPLLDAM